MICIDRMGNICSQSHDTHTVNTNTKFTMTPDQFIRHEFKGINMIKTVDNFIIELISQLKEIPPEIEYAEMLMKNASFTKKHIDSMESHQTCLQNYLTNLERSYYQYPEHAEWITIARDELRLTKSISRISDKQVNPKIMSEIKTIVKRNNDQYISNQFRRIPNYLEVRSMYKLLKITILRLETTVYQRKKLRQEIY